MAGQQADLPFTFASLKWRKCAETPFRMRHAHAVYLNKLYVGGGDTEVADETTILCYEPKINSWKKIKSPTYWSALTAYQDKLVMVGGKDEMEHAVNQLWSLQEDERWTDEIPPMPTPRWGASAVNTGRHLIVAGGIKQGSVLNVVEVFDGSQWSRTGSSPKVGFAKSTLHNGAWYWTGGWNQKKSVLYATVDSLITTAESSEGKADTIWKTLPEVPLECSSIVAYRNMLLAVGGSEIDPPFTPYSAIYGYITSAESWVHIGELPVPMGSTCSIVLPSNELLVVGGQSATDKMFSSFVFKATLRVPSLQQSCVMTIAENNIDYLKLPPHLQKMVERYF